MAKVGTRNNFQVVTIADEFIPDQGAPTEVGLHLIISIGMLTKLLRVTVYVHKSYKHYAIQQQHQGEHFKLNKEKLSASTPANMKCAEYFFKLQIPIPFKATSRL